LVRRISQNGFVDSFRFWIKNQIITLGGQCVFHLQD
jgi:hypothetical protein